MKDSLKKIVLSSAFILFAFLVLSMPNMAKAAAPTGTAATVQDGLTPSTVKLVVTGTDFISFVGSGTVTANGADLLNITYRTIHPVSAVIDSPTSLTLTFPITLGTDKSGDLTFAGGTLQDGIGGGTPNLLITVINAAIVDSAKPQIVTFNYIDANVDGKIDGVIVGFSESVTGASVLGANDLNFTNVGDFTSAAFGPLVTNLISGPVTQITVPLGTVSSVKDTKENSGTIAISSKSLFSLTDGTNVNSTLGAQTQATFVDNAKPQIKTFTYSDANNDGMMDSVLVTYTETLAAGSNLRALDLIFTSVGDFTSAAFGANASNLVGAGGMTSTSITLGTASSVVDTHEDSGTIAISTQNLFSLLDAAGNNNTTLGAQSGNATFLDAIKPMVISTVPVNASVNQNNTANIVIVFSEAMNTASLVPSSTFTTKDAGVDTGDTYTASWSIDQKTVNLAHAIYRQKGHVYTAALTTGVQDVALNGMLAYSWTFTPLTTRTSTSSYNPGDVTAPTETSVMINAGASKVSSSNVTLTLSAKDATQMMISNTPDFYGASYETYATSKAWMLSAGNGSKTVFAIFKDAAGNVSNLVGTTTVVDSSLVPAVTPAAGTTTISTNTTVTVPATPATPGTETEGCKKGFLFSSTTGQACVFTSTTPAVPATPGSVTTTVTTTSPEGVTVVSVFTRSIKYGERGNEVKKFQQFLKDRGHLKGKVDGSFGPMTKAALKAFQKENGLSADGIFGAKTLKKINDLM